MFVETTVMLSPGHSASVGLKKGAEEDMKALDGVLVLDLSRYGPGKYCTVLLADLGAKVITLEDPTLSEGEMGRYFCDDTTGRYVVYNRGKQSMTLNLKTDEGKRIFYQLAQKADVIVEGFRPGVVRRLEVDYDTVKGINPRIVYCSLTGYGQTGPYALRPGHDIDYTALGGILGLTGEPDRAPVPLGAFLGDVGALLMAMIGILTSLFAREKTGRGQYVDVAMLDGVLTFLWFTVGRDIIEGKPVRRGELQAFGSQPRYHVYPTKDGKFISTGALDSWFWENLCKALGREDFVKDLEPTGERAREIFAAFEQIFRSKTRDEWETVLDKANTCFSPVYDVNEALSNPQSVHRGTVKEVTHPKLGRMKQVGFPVRFSDLETSADSSSFPAFGEHTEQILGTLGYTERSISELRAKKVI